MHAKSDETLSVVASAETHAMLFPCDCPIEPGGGLAKRAHAIDSLSGGASAALIVDAGGFSGGGLYDSYTEGRALDSIRTIKTILAMKAMNYDAAAIGDDDLQYGGAWLKETASKAGLPLVSANCLFHDSALIGVPYITVRKGRYRYAITGLTTEDRLYSFSDSVIVLPPLQALKRIWPDMVKKADFQVVLSHLGEELSRTVADSFPKCDIIVNGHRKISPRSTFYQGKTLIMQFGFAGKNLSYAFFAPEKHALPLRESGWLPIPPEISNDSAVAALIRMPQLGASVGALPPPVRETVLDLYIMSDCPYGLKALKELTDALPAFPRVEWRVRFIGTLAADGSLSSLHGSDEVKDEMLWLAVQAVYPEKWFPFLRGRASAAEGTPTDAIANAMGLDRAKLQAWAAAKGKQELAVHYNRSVRIGVQASPTLLLNNAPLDIEITKQRLGKVLCAEAPGSSAYCDSVPECFDEGDCRKKGKVGTCVQGKGKPRCEYKDAVRFSLTVLMPDSLVSRPEREIIATTRELFEGAAVETVSARSEAGRKLLAAFEPKALPYYLFDDKVAEAENYFKLEPGVERKNGKFVFREGYVKKAYFIKRPLTPGSCDIYIDPMFPGAKDALALALTLQKKQGLRMRIMPLLSISAEMDSISAEDRLTREEAQRWLLLSERYPDKYGAYLESFVKRNDTSYWFLSLTNLKIDVDDFVKRVKADGSRTLALWKTMMELGLAGPVEIVINNREIVRVKSQKDLAELFDRIGK
jgi:hypothetical protein